MRQMQTKKYIFSTYGESVSDALFTAADWHAYYNTLKSAKKAVSREYEPDSGHFYSVTIKKVGSYGAVTSKRSRHKWGF